MSMTETYETRVQKALGEIEQIRQKNQAEAKDRLTEVYRMDPEIRTIDDRLSATGFNAIQTYIKSGSSLSREELVAKLKDENLRLHAERSQRLKALHLPEDYTKVRYDCPECKDTGFVNGKRCRCLNQRLIQMATVSSRIQKSLVEDNFDTFDLNLYSREPFRNFKDTPYQYMQKVLSSLRTFADRFPNNDPKSIYFYGAPGTGKTFCCHCLAKAILDRGYNVLYLTADELCEVLEDKRMRRTESMRRDLLTDQVESVDLLIIDDLGSELRTPISTSLLLNCINGRMMDRLSTLITSNLSVSDLKKEYSERLSSRISGAYQVMQLYGQDLRQKIK